MLRLPEEIQVDIFLRLPVKSILSCRYVCKPWRTLLYNPKFIKDHLNRSSKENPSLMLITGKCDSIPDIPCLKYYASVLSASSSAPSSSSPSITHTCKVVRRMGFLPWETWCRGISIMASCNGLICMGNQLGSICIWNPTTGESKIKPISVWKFYTESHYDVRYGFGYDCLLDDYKLVRIEAGKEHSYSEIKDSYSEIKVYTVGSESLKTIQTPNQYTFPVQRRFSVSLLNGALHWASFVKAINSNVIVTFDVTSEKFVDFVYPEEHRLPQQGKYDFVGLLEDRLCLIVFHGIVKRNGIRVMPYTDIWVMQDYGVRESWTKQFSLTASAFIDIESLKLVWSFTTGEILLCSRNKTRLYDPKNDETKVLKFDFINDMEWNGSVSYMESLERVSYVESLERVK